MKSISKYLIDPIFQKGHLVLIIASLLTVAFAQLVVAEEAHEGATHEFHRHHMVLILGNIQNDGSKKGLSAGPD